MTDTKPNTEASENQNLPATMDDVEGDLALMRCNTTPATAEVERIAGTLGTLRANCKARREALDRFDSRLADIHTKRNEVAQDIDEEAEVIEQLGKHLAAIEAIARKTKPSPEPPKRARKGARK